MGFTCYQPHAALSRYVEKIIKVEFHLQANPVQEIIFVPDYHQYLCFILEDKIKVMENGLLTTRAESILVGSHLSSTTVQLGKNHCAIYVQFKAAGLHHLFQVPQQEMLCNCYDASLFLGAQAAELSQRLCDARSGEEQNTILQCFLLKRLNLIRNPHPFDQAILAFTEGGGNLSIEEIAAQSCLSMRQFERICKLKLGLSPKLFGRLIRFYNVYKLKELHPDLSWCEMALRCGYYDHMHMIRDFKKFAGICPGGMEEDNYYRSFPYQRA